MLFRLLAGILWHSEIELYNCYNSMPIKHITVHTICSTGLLPVTDAFTSAMATSSAAWPSTLSPFNSPSCSTSHQWLSKYSLNLIFSRVMLSWPMFGRQNTAKTKLRAQRRSKQRSSLENSHHCLQHDICENDEPAVSCSSF